MPSADSWLAEVEARKDEPLHPDLAEYLYESDFMGQMLKHPLVFDIPHHPMLAWRANDQYEAKTEAVRQALDKGDYNQAIWLHEKPYRVHALLVYASQMKAPEYWATVSDVWTNSENIWQNQAQWKQLLTSRRPGRKQHMMDYSERRALENMPAAFPIWRGFNSGGTKLGWSWTTSKDKAEWFGRRLLREDERPLVAGGMVPRSRVIAYLTERGEKEIVVDPRHVQDIKVTNL